MRPMTLFEIIIQGILECRREKITASEIFIAKACERDLIRVAMALQLMKGEGLVDKTDDTYFVTKRGECYSEFLSEH